MTPRSDARRALPTRLESVLRAAKSVNQIVGQEQDVESLAGRICRAITRTGVFSGAWLAFHSEFDGKWLFGSSGFGYHTVRPRGRRAQGSLPSCVQSILTQTRATQLRHSSEPCASCSFGRRTSSSTSLLLPLTHNRRAVGALALCLSDSLGLTKDEQSVLTGMAGELALAYSALCAAWRAEHDRQEVEALYRTAFQHTGTAMLVVESDGRVSLVNTMFESLTGYSRDEIEGSMLWEEFFAADDLPRMRRYRRKRLLSAEYLPRQVQARLMKRTGETRWVLITPGLVPGTGRMIGSMVDVTSKRQATEKIRRLNQYLESVVESTGVLLVVLDATGRVLVWNKATEEATGYSRIEAVGHSRVWTATASPCPACAHLRAIGTSNPAEPRVHDFEGTLLTKTGETRTIRWQERELYGNRGNALGHVVLGLDITQQLAVQRKVLDAEAKAQHAARLAILGQTVARMTHEIANPLTGILGLAGMLDAEHLSADAKDSVEAIREGAQRISTTVTGLLAFSRKQPLTIESVSLNDAIRDSLRLYGCYLKGQGIAVETSLDPSLPRIRGDISALQQVALNLMSNAATAVSSNEGDKRLSIHTYSEGDSVVAEFADNGPGVPLSLRTRVFEPFYTTSEPGRGTGLGLSICHGLVAEHEGTMHVRSRDGGGAVFVVALPIGK